MRIWRILLRICPIMFNQGILYLVKHLFGPIVLFVPFSQASGMKKGQVDVTWRVGAWGSHVSCFGRKNAVIFIGNKEEIAILWFIEQEMHMFNLTTFWLIRHTVRFLSFLVTTATCLTIVSLSDYCAWPPLGKSMWRALRVSTWEARQILGNDNIVAWFHANFDCVIGNTAGSYFEYACDFNLRIT